MAAAASAPATKPVSGGQWTPRLVCEALAWRESKLAECSFGFTEDRTASHPGLPGEVLITTSKVKVKCHNGNTLIDLTEDNFTAPNLSMKHALQTWNGSRCEWLELNNLGAGRSELQGGIKGVEPAVLAHKSFFSELGMRQAQVDLPWSGWIRGMIGKGAAASVSETVENGEACITLVVSPTPDGSTDQITATFLPGKDFVTRDFQIDDLGAPPGKGSTNKFHVDKVEQLDGFWMPAEIHRIHASTQNANSIKDTLTAFSAAPPSDEEMAVKFPAGTHVMDAINMKNYILQADGNHEDRSYFDPNTGKLIQPGTQPSR
jgi:hypothetical protein